MVEVDPITWASEEAKRLSEFSTENIAALMGSGASAGDLAPGVEFLRRQAGPRSSFAGAADQLLKKPSEAWRYPHTLAGLLSAWSDWQSSGLAAQPPFEVRARAVAANDLMEYVGKLLKDRKAQPAAPVVLAGAALEEHLRSLLDHNGLTPTRGRGLDVYGADLKAAGIITGQDAKQITAWAGLRNRAAHGEKLETLTMSEAQIMADGVNLFLQTYQVTT
jgi:hypothetical protein